MLKGDLCQIDPPSLQLDTSSQVDGRDDGDSRKNRRHRRQRQEQQRQQVQPPHRRLQHSSRRDLKKKPKEIVVVGSKVVDFNVEMDVNHHTAVWWRHLQDQQDHLQEEDSSTCDNRGDESVIPSSSLLAQVDLIVFEDDSGISSCEDYYNALERVTVPDGDVRGDDPTRRNMVPEVDDEVLVTYLRQRVHFVLKDVWIQSINISLGGDSTTIQSTASAGRMTQTVSISMNEITLLVSNEDDSDDENAECRICPVYHRIFQTPDPE